MVLPAGLTGYYSETGPNGYSLSHQALLLSSSRAFLRRFNREMDMTTGNERDYFMGLTTERQLQYISRTWGVQASVTLHVAVNPDHKWVLIGSCDLLSMVHRLELMEPNPVIMTAKLSEIPSASVFLGRLMWQWMQDVRTHMDEMSGRTP